MTAPESNSAAAMVALKRPSELSDSNSSPDNKRLKKEEESEIQSTTIAASSTTKGIFALEADAAEDKGLRHSMEDAWVVLQDAALGSPGNLRSLDHYFTLNPIFFF